MNGEFCIAAHALVYLEHMGRALSSEELAKNICTNPARVRKVLSQLKKAGLVESREGAGNSGYRFTGDAKAVTLAQLAHALDERCVELKWRSGSVDMECLVASGMGAVMGGVADELDELCRARLARITIADLSAKIFKG